MRCPYCSAQDTKVIDSRLAAEGDQVRRRRECKKCQARFTTYETVEWIMPSIVKADDRREPFEEGKLRKGMMLALHKRPVSTDRIDAAVHRILRQLSGYGERELPSQKLGEWMMYELRGLDPVAYVRFASVYRSFQDTNAFREEIDRLEKHPEVDADPMSLLTDEDA